MIDPTEFANKLANSGVDNLLQDIANKTKEKMAAVEALDIAAGVPSDLFAVTDDAFNTIKGAGESLLEQADALKPNLPNLQSLMGDVLGDAQGLAGSAASQLGALIDAAGGAAAGIPSVDSLSSAALGSLQTPDLSGIGALQGAIDGAASSALGTIQNAAGGLQSALTTSSVAGAAAGGFDPGKMIPNIQFKTQAVFDAAGIQIGEEIIPIKLGSPATVPVQDSKNEAPPQPISLQQVTKTLTAAVDTGLRVATKMTTINTFDGPVTTDIVFDEGTGENIIFETQVDEDGNKVMVPSGFASQEDFDAAYAQARESAKSAMQTTTGLLKQVVPEVNKAFQGAAKSLSSIASTAAKSAAEPGKAISRQIDPVTGVPVDSANALNILSNLAKELEKAGPKLKDEVQGQFDFLDQLGEKLDRVPTNQADLDEDLLNV